MTHNGIAPVFDQIFVRPDIWDGKLSLTPAVRTGPMGATVLAMGPGRPSEYTATIVPLPNIKPGDKILFHGGAGTVIGDSNPETAFQVIGPRDVIGVVTG